MKLSKIVAITLLVCSGTIASQNISENILEHVTDQVKIDLKETTKKLKEIVDYTTNSGRLSLIRALRGRRRSKQTIKISTNEIEKKINDAIANIEQEAGKNQSEIKTKTGIFIAETKKDVYTMHKKMVEKMKKLIRVKQTEVVKKKANKTKEKIHTFEQNLLVKIARLKEELQHDLER